MRRTALSSSVLSKPVTGWYFWLHLTFFHVNLTDCLLEHLCKSTPAETDLKERRKILLQGGAANKQANRQMANCTFRFSHIFANGLISKVGVTSLGSLFLPLQVNSFNYIRVC